MSLVSPSNPLPITFTHGEGCWLWDTNGKKYLDGLSGVAVSALGHSHPALVTAISDQASKVLHTCNLYRIEQQQQLAQQLTAAAKMQQVFFANSGAEANEAAIKLARLYGHQHDIEQPTIIVAENAYHGCTLATLSASGSRKIQAGFEPLVSGFIRAPYNDIGALHKIAEHSQNIVAVMLEPIQSKGGMHIPDENYLSEVRKLCDNYNWLMILDEIQTGIARTGAFYAYQHRTDSQPDIVTSAKGLGGGVPISACLMNEKTKNLFKPGTHASTFGGNPLACRAALAVLETIKQQDLTNNAKTMGAALLKSLRQQLKDHELVKEIRGQGLMIGIEMQQPCFELIRVGLEKGILFDVATENTLRLLPPLIISETEVDQLVALLVESIKELSLV